MKKIFRYPMAILFSVFVMSVFLIDVCNKDKERSEFENTSLAQKPSFSWTAFSDGTFGNNYVKYINEQFLGRDQWITLKATADMALGRTEGHGVVYGKDHQLLEKLQVVESKPGNAGSNVVEERNLKRSVDIMKSFLQMYDRNITFSLVPNAYAVLENKVPYAFPGINQEEETQRIYQELSQTDEQLTTIDFTEVLKEHQDEYIYYRTDHHWTTLGAYYAYTEYCREKGLTPVELSELEKHEVSDFYGTFYSKAKRPGQPSDTITWYDIPIEDFSFTANLLQDKEFGEVIEQDGEELLSVDTLMDERKFQTRDKYAAFTWGNPGYAKITSSHNLNHTEGKTSRLLIIKDSYANSMIPYLTYNYDEIVVVDLRYLSKSVKDLMQQDFDDIFVMYNFSTFLTEHSSLARLKF